jgi:hypothetical protein
VSTLNKQHVIRRLRAACGYSDLDARRTVKDVLTVLRDLLEDLGTDESLVLEHIGRFVSHPTVRHSGKSLHRLHFQPCESMVALFYRRPLAPTDPRARQGGSTHA